MAQFKKLVALPAYNEEKTIGNILEKLVKLGHFYILVVDDGSYDDTAKIANSKSVHVISHKKNLGYEETLNTAYSYALCNRFDSICFFDADGEHHVSDLTKFEFLDGNCLVKLGNRSSTNRLGEAVAKKLGSFIFGIDDPYCGMRSYNLKFLNDSDLPRPGDKIGTRLPRFISKKYGRNTIRNIPIDVSKRRDASRFSDNSLKANIFLLLNIIF